MELNEIFFNLMITCGVVLSFLATIGLFTNEDNSIKLGKRIIMRIIANLSFYGFPIALIGWIWTR